MALGENTPKLGFGLMRLPMIGDEVDIEQTKKMVDLFLAAGFTYFDTAYGYLGGKSEEAVKTAIVDRYPRESFTLATKLPAWAGAKTAEEAKEMFYTSLRRTGAGYFDFYLLHNLGGDRTKVFDDFGIWDFVHEQKEKGLIKHLGFSMHDSAEALDKVLTEHPEVEFVQLQINYADWESDSVQSRKCYEVARKYDKPVIIMEPVKGGSLATMTPEIQKLFKDAAPDASPASWAVRYCASLEGIITVLSGMSNEEQLNDNVAYMEHFQPLTDSERQVIGKAVEILNSIPTIPCTACKYCVDGCPQKISIPDIFSAMNQFTLYNDKNGAKNRYQNAVKEGGKASDCIQCGNCEGHCPQKIQIIEELKKAAATLE